MMRWRGRRRSSSGAGAGLDMATGRDYLMRPRFLIHLLIVMLHFVMLLMAVCNNNWPRFCAENNWAFFSTVGILISSQIISLCSLLTYIIFEDLNWVLMSLIIFIHGTLFAACGGTYIAEEVLNCTKCEVPILRVTNRSTPIRRRENSTTFGKLFDNMEQRFQGYPAVLDLYPDNVIAPVNKRIERSIGYITFILGILYLFTCIYYVFRRERA